MSAKMKRKIYFRTTKYQERILYLVLLPILLACVILFLSISYFYYFDISEILFRSAPLPILKEVVPCFLIGLSLIFLVVAVWSYRISSKLLGAFDRIIRELDEVIETKEKKQIKTRKGDDLAKELLKRINILIDRMP